MTEPRHDKYALYLKDLGTLVKEYALEARNDYKKAKGSHDEQFKAGYLMGYHRFITLMQQQAEAFDIPLYEISMNDISEKDLLS
jgi:hypothetical protein